MARSYSAKQKRLRVRVEGAEQIVKALKGMDDKASKVLTSAAKAGGEIALSDAKRNCPVNTGALRDSIKMNVNKVTNTKADVKIDYDKSIKYGVFVELGTRGRAANPFMRNAVDKNQDKINSKITDTVRNAVKHKF